MKSQNYIVFRWGTKWKKWILERLALATEGRKAYVATGQLLMMGNG